MSEEIKFEPFEVDLGENGGLQRFATKEKLQKFIDEEVEFWDFLKTDKSENPYKEYHEFVYNNILIPLVELQKEIRITPLSPQYNLLVIKKIKQVFLRRNIPCSSTATAQFIEKLAEDFDVLVCQTVALISCKAIIPSNYPFNENIILGKTVFANFKLGIDKRATIATKISLTKISSTYSEKISELEAEIQLLKEKHSSVSQDAIEAEIAATKEFESRIIAAEGAVQSRWDDFYEKANIDADQAHADIENTKKTYEEFMKLKAPSDYWRAKAAGHSKRSKLFGGIAAVWAFLAGGALMALLWCIFNKAYSVSMSETPTPTNVLLLLSGVGLVASTIVFWVARLLVRLFLSELHLAMDAEERVTMVQSYLALTEQDKISDTERNLVLSSLFRPTQDGIVKDDSSADPTLIGLLGKLGK